MENVRIRWFVDIKFFCSFYFSQNFFISIFVGPSHRYIDTSHRYIDTLIYIHTYMYECVLFGVLMCIWVRNVARMKWNFIFLILKCIPCYSKCCFCDVFLGVLGVLDWPSVCLSVVWLRVANEIFGFCHINVVFYMRMYMYINMHTHSHIHI